MPRVEGVDCSRLRIFPHGNDDSVRANRLVNALRSQRPALLQCARVTAAKDLAESRFMGMLTEDRAQVPPTRRRSKSRAPAAPRANAAAARQCRRRAPPSPRTARHPCPAPQASMSYVEFLCHVHRQIQARFG